MIPLPSANFPWSPEANYPPGTDPWSGQPTKIVPPDDKFTPGTGAPAPYFNKLLNERDLVIQQLVAGTDRVRSGTQAAMTAQTAMVDGDVFFVIGQGFYRYNSAGTGVPTIWSIAPDVSPGAWEHELMNARNTANKLLTLNSLARISSATPHNGNFFIAHGEFSLTQLFTSSSPTALTSASLPLGVINIGDILLLTMHIERCSIYNGGSAGGLARGNFFVNGTEVAGGYEMSMDSSGTATLQSLALNNTFVATSTTSTIVTFDIRAILGTCEVGPSAATPVRMRVLVIRP